MNQSAKSAVLLLAHGSPDRVEEIPEFLRFVTGGRPMPDAVVKEVQHRYGLIGSSPSRRCKALRSGGVSKLSLLSTR